MHSGELTAGERVVITRRRKRLSQRDFCALYDLSMRQLVACELDRLQVPRIRTFRGFLSPIEECYILRRRSGKSREECAADMGISPYWYSQMERGSAPCDRLLTYWNVQPA